jgi:hypothetical protein
MRRRYWHICGLSYHDPRRTQLYIWRNGGIWLRLLSGSLTSELLAVDVLCSFSNIEKLVPECRSRNGPATAVDEGSQS